MDAFTKVIAQTMSVIFIACVWVALKWFSNITGRVPRIKNSIKKLYEEYGENTTKELCDLAFKGQKEINEYNKKNCERRTEIGKLFNGELTDEEKSMLDKEYYILKDIQHLIDDLQEQEKEYKNARKIISKTIEKCKK